MTGNNFDLIETPEMAKMSRGGTETAMERLYDGRVPRKILEQFQIIPSRVRALKKDKYRVLWLHETPGDAEVQHLANGGWRNFHRLAFVSNWQMQHFILRFGIPWSKCAVMSHGIYPIDVSSRVNRSGRINLIYHSSPNRGLSILLPVFDRLARSYDIHLDVFSSFKLYGWGDRDREYAGLFDFAKRHPMIAYHEMAEDHEEIRKALAKSDIFAYPSIWPENSCLCLMESMSAGLLCVHSNYGALFETAANWTSHVRLSRKPSETCRNVWFGPGTSRKERSQRRCSAPLSIAKGLCRYVLFVAVEGKTMGGMAKQHTRCQRTQVARCGMNAPKSVVRRASS